MYDYYECPPIGTNLIHSSIELNESGSGYSNRDLIGTASPQHVRIIAVHELGIARS